MFNFDAEYEEIMAIMAKKAEEEKQKVDDYVACEAAKYAMREKRIRRNMHTASRCILFMSGCGLAWTLHEILHGTVWTVAGCMLATVCLLLLSNHLNYKSKKRGNKNG